MFLKASAMENAFCLKMKGECKVSCVKSVVWSIVAQKDTNILIFYIFEYGAEFGAECSAKSGAKQYFMENIHPALTVLMVALAVKVKQNQMVKINSHCY